MSPAGPGQRSGGVGGTRGQRPVEESLDARSHPFYLRDDPPSVPWFGSED